MEMDKKKRITNFSADEKSLVSRLVLKYKDVVENKRTDATSNTQKTKGWIQLAAEFNSVSSHCFRTPSSLKTCWENIKRQTKRDSSKRKKEVFMTGGGMPPPSPSRNEVIVEAILGPGLEGLHNKFDSDAFCDKENVQNIIMNKDADLRMNDEFEEVVTVPVKSTQEKSNIEVTWQEWTPRSLRQPVTTTLREDDINNKRKRRRPQTESLADQLIIEKIKLVKTLHENAMQESQMKMMILEEQLKQEKYKTAKLLSESVS